MLASIIYLLIYLFVAVVIIEIIFWILSLIFPTTVISSRIRGLAYALVLLVVLIWALQHFGILR